VEIVFCSDKTIRRLNAQYRHKDKPTDVLSFEFREPDFLGELYFFGNGRNPGAALQTFVPGRGGAPFNSRMFHLLGFNHKNRRDRMVMQKNEQHYWPLSVRRKARP